MKKILLLPLMLLLLFSLAACSSSEDEQEQPGEIVWGEGRCLVVYYTWSNNTGAVAEELHTVVGGDIVEVEPSTPYTTDYNEMLTIGLQELNAIDNSESYPAINTSIPDFDDYDVIFIGYPLWYSRMATPMQAFLHNHAEQLAGKTIALFCTSASNGIFGTVADARRICPDATFTEALRVGSSSANDSHNSIINWLRQMGAFE